MQPLQPPDSHHLAAASGWMGLGRYVEANEELEKIAPANLAHPDVMEILWHIYAKAGIWTICADVAAAIIKLDPDRAFGYTHRSFALYELKRTQEAFDLLVPVAAKFPKLWRIPYALACYCAQMGRLIECQLWLQKALTIDRPVVKRTAISDTNLNPLWTSMSGKNVLKGLAVDPAPGVPMACVSHASLPVLPMNRLA